MDEQTDDRGRDWIQVAMEAFDAMEYDRCGAALGIDAALDRRRMNQRMDGMLGGMRGMIEASALDRVTVPVTPAGDPLPDAPTALVPVGMSSLFSSAPRELSPEMREAMRRLAPEWHELLPPVVPDVVEGTSTEAFGAE